MYAPPRYLTSADLPELLRYLGARQFRSLCNVSERTLRRWLTEGNAPLAIVRLAWYASPLGREAAELDITNELRAQHALAEAINAQLHARLPLTHPSRYHADACNEPLYTVPVPTTRSGAPSWHPAHPRNRRRNTSEQTA